MLQDNVLVEIRTDIGIIKHDQSRLSQSIESLAESIQSLSESFKSDHNDLRKEHDKIKERLIKVEQNIENKKGLIKTWISPILNPLITSILIGGIYVIANHSH